MSLANTDYDPDRSEEAHTARRRLFAAAVSSRDTSLKGALRSFVTGAENVMLSPDAP